MKKLILSIIDFSAYFCANVFGFIYGLHFQRLVRFFRDGTFSYAHAKKFKKFGKGAGIAYNVVLANPRYVSIGNNSTIGDRTVISTCDRHGDERFKPEIVIGNNTCIGAECHITAINKIVFGNGVLLGKKITVTDNSHGACTADELDIAPSKRRLVSKGPVIIEDNVWIGDKATILPGVRIGRGAIIAANAVITTDVPEGCIAGGIPAKIIKVMQETNRAK